MTTIAHMKDLPPGSPEALAAGCQCPVIDNCRGKGAYTDTEGHAQFWVNGECPVHKAESVLEEEDSEAMTKPKRRPKVEP